MLNPEPGLGQEGLCKGDIQVFFPYRTIHLVPIISFSSSLYHYHIFKSVIAPVLNTHKWFFFPCPGCQLHGSFTCWKTKLSALRNHPPAPSKGLAERNAVAFYTIVQWLGWILDWSTGFPGLGTSLVALTHTAAASLGQGEENLLCCTNREGKLFPRGDLTNQAQSEGAGVLSSVCASPGMQAGCQPCLKLWQTALVWVFFIDIWVCVISITCCTSMCYSRDYLGRALETLVLVSKTKEILEV